MSDFNVYADQLNIETPEQVDLVFPIAGVGSRFIAVLIDWAIQALVYLILFVILYLVASAAPAGSTTKNTPTEDKWFTAGFIMVLFLMDWGYYTLFEAFWHGQTPGKRIMKLRVLKDSGRSITLFEAMVRNLLRGVDGFPGVALFGLNSYGVGLITMLCNRRNKRLGDIAAGTIVVHERMDEQPLMSHNISRTFTSSMYPEQPMTTRLMPKAQEEWTANESGLPADAVARLQPSDLNVIDTFFSRALDLSIEKREQLGTRVAAQMCTKMQFPLPEGMRPERLLELIAHKMRSHGR
jgi:uncharacterized RDD family membrane protein YckC